jgi:hypothetical protein
VSDNSDVGWDVFISYAREDREGFVIELVRALRRLGLNVWYDQIIIKRGQSIRREIDRGISKSRYGIAVLSNSYFLPTKTWTQLELDAFFSQESSDKHYILPIWHGLSAADVARYSPLVAGKLAFNSKEGAEGIASEIRKILQPRIFPRFDPCNAKKSVVIFPQLGTVWIEDIDKKRAKMLDFTGKDVEPEEAIWEKKEHEGKEIIFEKGEFLIQINEKLCSDDDWGKEVYLNVGNGRDVRAFIPMFFCEGYTLGKFNEEIGKRLISIQKAAMAKGFDVPPSWRRIEVGNGQVSVSPVFRTE